MLLPLKVAQGVRDGSVTLAFRRWRKQDVEPGRRFTTAAGMVRVDEVTVVDAAAITDEEARQAGWADADRLRRRLDPDDSLPTYRVRLSWDGEDPRIALREDADLTDADVAAVDARLDRLDRASSEGPWTMTTLDLIRTHPQRRAPDLAEMVGRDTAPFKLDVRKLKALGSPAASPWATRSPHAAWPTCARRHAGPDSSVRTDLSEPADRSIDRPYLRPVPKLLTTFVLLVLLALAPAAHADDEPTHRDGGSGEETSQIEEYASYEPQTTCHPKPRVGTKVLAEWLKSELGGGGGATGRACGGGASEHKDGRAIDWTLDATNKADRKIARAFLEAAFATDEAGNTHALARRMGIMYVIWNDRMYSAWDQFEPEDYLSSGCKSKKKCSKTLRHRDHVHISLSMAGAKAKTSWYDGRI